MWPKRAWVAPSVSSATWKRPLSSPIAVLTTGWLAAPRPGRPDQVEAVNLSRIWRCGLCSTALATQQCTNHRSGPDLVHHRFYQLRA